MKAVLEFTLPEERNEHLAALHGGAALYALSEIREHLRTKLKHGDLDDVEQRIYEDIQAEFHLVTEGLPDELV